MSGFSSLRRWRRVGERRRVEVDGGGEVTIQRRKDARTREGAGDLEQGSQVFGT